MSTEPRQIRLLMELRAEGVTDAAVLGAIERTPREDFVPAQFRDRAYENTALPIGEGRRGLIWTSGGPEPRALESRPSWPSSSDGPTARCTPTTPRRVESPRFTKPSPRCGPAASGANPNLLKKALRYQ